MKKLIFFLLISFTMSLQAMCGDVHTQIRDESKKQTALFERMAKEAEKQTVLSERMAKAAEDQANAAKLLALSQYTLAGGELYKETRERSDVLVRELLGLKPEYPENS